MLTSQLFTQDQLFLSPYPSIFLHLFLPKSPSSIPLPTFGFSPNHPVISLVQSQTALPLHPIMCPTPLGSIPPSQSGRCSGFESSSWVSHPDKGSPGTVALRGCPLLQAPNLFPSPTPCPYASCSGKWASDGLRAVARTGHYLGSSACHCLFSFLGVQMSFQQIT